MTFSLEHATVCDLESAQMARVVAVTNPDPEYLEHVQLNDSYVSTMLEHLAEGMQIACFQRACFILFVLHAPVLETIP
jgi:hypothetical protein